MKNIRDYETLWRLVHAVALSAPISVGDNLVQATYGLGPETVMALWRASAVPVMEMCPCD